MVMRDILFAALASGTRFVNVVRIYSVCIRILGMLGIVNR